MKMYRHRIKLDDATREELTEKYGNNFEGQYLVLYCPYLEINIHDLPYYIEQFGQKEWRDMGEVTKSSNGGFRLDLEYKNSIENTKSNGSDVLENDKVISIVPFINKKKLN